MSDDRLSLGEPLRKLEDGRRKDVCRIEFSALQAYADASSILYKEMQCYEECMNELVEK